MDWGKMARKAAAEPDPPAPALPPPPPEVEPPAASPPAERTDALVRRVRALSVGGSEYIAQNSEDVVRTDATTGAQSTITGGEMHRALDLGAERGRATALRLQAQATAFEVGGGVVEHAPRGCAEARAEMAIAAHHLPAHNPTGGQIRRAWDNSAGSQYSRAVDQRREAVDACGACQGRHFTRDRGRQ